jgi:type IV secretory pathway TrbF-like protein
MINFAAVWQFAYFGCLLLVVVIFTASLWRNRSGSNKGRVAQQAFFGSVVDIDQPRMRPLNADVWRVVKMGDKNYDS